MMRKFIGAAILAATLGTASSASAFLFNENVTPDAIFGSGNANGNFTVDRQGGVELGLRAKIPFSGLIHSNGDGSYSYTLAEANPKWNFDWTINTDFDSNNPTGNKIDNFTYLLGIDFDPGIGTNFLVFDPVTPNTASNPAPLNVIEFYDHSIGDNSTPNGGGAEVPLSNPPTAAELLAAPGIYADLIANNNVLQQSWRHSFFPFHPTLTYDPTVKGIYDVTLAAFDGDGVQVAQTGIQVTVGIPEPSAVALLGIGLIGFGWMRRRKTA
jgi:hypothetical protein